MTKHTNKELAGSYVFPVNLNKKQTAEASKQLFVARGKTKAAMSEETKLKLDLLKLKFRLEEYIKKDSYDMELTFGFFLKNYVSLLNKRRNVFAKEITLSETELSQVINNHRPPPDYLYVRLEIHSNNSIPAVHWLRLAEKQKEYYIKTDSNLRKEQKRFVSNRLGIAI
jgi:hypothetical protein